MPGRPPGERRPPPTLDEALGAFKSAVLRPDGRCMESAHFADQMAQAGFDASDLTRLAHQGRIPRAPEWDTPHRAWKFRIEGHGVDRRWLGVIFNVMGPHAVKAVTVLRRGKRRRGT